MQLIKEKNLPIELIWNDVSGIIDDDLITFLKSNPRINYVFCHNLSNNREETSSHMNFVSPLKERDFLESIIIYFQKAYQIFTKHNIISSIYFDPCFGFAKSREQNIYLINHLDKLIYQFPTKLKWLLGISKKSFLRPTQNLKNYNQQIIKDSEYTHVHILSKWLLQLPEHSLIIRMHNPQILAMAKNNVRIF